jgi:hypothetical protein
MSHGHNEEQNHNIELGNKSFKSAAECEFEKKIKLQARRNEESG